MGGLSVCVRRALQQNVSEAYRRLLKDDELTKCFVVRTKQAEVTKWTERLERTEWLVSELC